MQVASHHYRGFLNPPFLPFESFFPPPLQLCKILSVQNCNLVIEVCTRQLAMPPLVNIGGLDLALVSGQALAPEPVRVGGSRINNKLQQTRNLKRGRGSSGRGGSHTSVRTSASNSALRAEYGAGYL